MSGDENPSVRSPLLRITDGDGQDIAEETETWRGSLKAAWGVSRMVVLLLAAIAGVGLWQLYLSVIDDPNPALSGGLSAMALASGRWWTFLTSMFLHAGPVHLLANGSVLLAFGPVVSRRFGGDPGGQLRFLGFYLACGLAGGLAYVLLRPDGAVPAIGASGAISGLWGAAARMKAREDTLAPIWSKTFGRQAFAALLANLGILLVFLISSLSRGYMVIAWEAHLGGFVAGALLIGLVRPSRISSPA